ncbi:helix-hairpin-helix domain-containing protein [Curvibacter sp. APW13]|uniref:ComEA family DNA-binding protein n=1 Tax=Curvibacter sp. APW13 TaxID=3077236 RepID=UPI0028DF4B9C|nr:helix-hairpin-helix domain-containing protein [Curvibacter sp. APW13]MDT8989290.1 helix-hairpin-helix domain-containing protein [Curvibacter sp. APW13]
MKQPLHTLRTGLAALCLALATSAFAVDANTATEAELDSVKGLGPSQTARILQAREKGLFKNWADLMARVKGIKPATAAKLTANGLTVNEQGYQPPAK